MHFYHLIIFTIFIHCRAIPIDNGVEGDPEVECAADSLTINFNVRNDFQGHVYVKGRYAEGGECKSDGNGRRVASIKLAFSNCGTKRERSLNPKGVLVSNTVVITFHPQFLTKVDRAYTVQCFYMEADKTVSQDLEVSEITTVIQTQAAAMPICRYEILDGGASGQPVKFATIGQMVYHKWTCETETVDMFCALIHSCTVDDGAGNNVQLLNEQGCALDKHLLGNLEYSTDLTAGHEAHVFKYADKPALFFNCQISILGKEPGQPCNRPQCPEPAGLGGKGETSVPRGSVAPPSSVTPVVATRPRGGNSPAPTPRPPSAPPVAQGSSTKPRSTPLAPAPIASGAVAAALRRDPNPARNFRFRYARAVEADINATTAITPTYALDILGTLDVAAQAIHPLGIGIDQESLPQSLRRQLRMQDRKNESSFIDSINFTNHLFCMQPVLFGALFIVAVIILVACISFYIFLCIRRYQNV